MLVVEDALITGGCLCGGVRFALSAPPHGAGYCHCTRCQRRTGTAASAQARIDGRTLRLLQGEDLLQAWRHPDGGYEKCFCSVCGSHLFSCNPEDPTQVSVRMGAFDEDPEYDQAGAPTLLMPHHGSQFPMMVWSASPRQSHSSKSHLRATQ